MGDARGVGIMIRLLGIEERMAGIRVDMEIDFRVIRCDLPDGFDRHNVIQVTVMHHGGTSCVPVQVVGNIASVKNEKPFR